jgi:hypothetical protein
MGRNSQGVKNGLLYTLGSTMAGAAGGASSAILQEMEEMKQKRMAEYGVQLREQADIRATERGDARRGTEGTPEYLAHQQGLLGLSDGQRKSKRDELYGDREAEAKVSTAETNNKKASVELQRVQQQLSEAGVAKKEAAAITAAHGAYLDAKYALKADPNNKDLQANLDRTELSYYKATKKLPEVVAGKVMKLGEDVDDMGNKTGIYGTVDAQGNPIARIEAKNLPVAGGGKQDVRVGGKVIGQAATPEEAQALVAAHKKEPSKAQPAAAPTASGTGLTKGQLSEKIRATEKALAGIEPSGFMPTPEKTKVEILRLKKELAALNAARDKAPSGI